MRKRNAVVVWKLEAAGAGRRTDVVRFCICFLLFGTMVPSAGLKINTHGISCDLSPVAESGKKIGPFALALRTCSNFRSYFPGETRASSTELFLQCRTKFRCHSIWLALSRFMANRGEDQATQTGAAIKRSGSNVPTVVSRGHRARNKFWPGAVAGPAGRTRRSPSTCTTRAHCAPTESRGMEPWRFHFHLESFRPKQHSLRAFRIAAVRASLMSRLDP